VVLNACLGVEVAADNKLIMIVNLRDRVFYQNPPGREGDGGHQNLLCSTYIHINACATIKQTIK